MGFNSQMDLALIEARQAAEAGEVPVGAVLVDTRGEIVAKAGNRTRRDCDPTAFATIWPRASTNTAPTGTSPASAACRASIRAKSI